MSSALGKIRNAYKMLVGTPVAEDQLGDIGVHGRQILKYVQLGEIRCEGV
jgi:hypothetical protein